MPTSVNEQQALTSHFSTCRRLLTARRAMVIQLRGGGSDRVSELRNHGGVVFT